MASGLKKTPSTKGRKQQALAKEVARALAKLPKQLPNPARHLWLVRHMERQNGRCAYCGIPMHLPPAWGRTARAKPDRHATLDHVVPLALSGADSEENTVAACEACNKAKAAMNAMSFRQTPFLMARKAMAAKVPDRQVTEVTVKLLRRKRK